MKMRLERAKQLLLGTYTDFFEFFNSTLIFVWGLWIILPFDTFDKISAFSIIKLYIPESLFALIPMVIGLVMFRSMIKFNESQKQKSILAASVFWVFLAVLFGGSSATSTGLPVYSMLALFSAISYLRQ